MATREDVLALLKKRRSRQGNDTTETSSSEDDRRAAVLELLKKKRGAGAVGGEYAALTQNKDFAARSQAGMQNFILSKRKQQEAQSGKSVWQQILEATTAPQNQFDNPIVSNMVASAENYRKDTSYMEPSDSWTQGQKDIFGYLYSEDQQKAFEYAQKVNDAIQKGKTDAQRQEIAEAATKDVWAGAGHTAAALLTAPTAIADFMDNVAEAAGRGTITQKGMLTPYDYSQAVTGGISQKLNEYGTIDESVPIVGGKGWGDVYGLGFSTAQSLIAGFTGSKLGTGALTMLQFFGQAAASGVDEQLEAGGTAGQALLYGAASGAAEAVAEKIGIDNLFSNAGAKTLKSMLGNMVKQGIAEGLEEGVTSVLNGFADQLIMGGKSKYSKAVAEYSKTMSEEEAKKKALQDTLEGVAFDMIGGLVSGGASTAVITGNRAVSNVKQGKGALSGLTKNEQAVVDKVYKAAVAEAEKEGKVSQKRKNEIYDQVIEQMDRGEIDTETIEEVLGGKTYRDYQDTVSKEESLAKQEKALSEEFQGLNKMVWQEMTGEQHDRREELRTQLSQIRQQIQEQKKNPARDQLKQQLGREVSELVKQERLGESYAERGRKAQAFQADVSQYDERQRATVQAAIDSGILNNTRRAHEFVDLVAKISADKGVAFNFADNKKLQETGFALEGVTVNGFVNSNGVTVNVNSAKALNSVVGHEIAHVLEGTELYDGLKTAITQYAESKGDFKTRLAQLTKLYEGKEGYEGADAAAKIEREVVADLVGDYLFTDKEFVSRLSAENRNVFEKIFDEVKYLCRMATAGSKEARQLEKVKKAFEEAYRAEGTKNPTGDGGSKYSLNQFEDGKRFVDVQMDAHAFDGMTVADMNRTAKSILMEKFAGKVIGIDNRVFVNGDSVNEYLHPSKAIDLDIRKPKLTAAGELDNLLDAGEALPNEPDGKDGHVHPDAIDFSYYKTIFKVGNEYFEGIINIKNIKRGKLLKDITKIRNITKDIVSSYGENPKSNFLRDASMDSIRNPGEDVNSKFSLSSAENVKAAEQHFGITYKISEAGYLLTDGRLLDFSGRHEGGPGGYRTVDHRDITDALGDDYGDDTYSGGMIRFMGEGNIRLSPESGGINLSVKPNKAQLSALDRYISNFRGEVILDIDDENGNTVVSVEYPKRTYSKRIINDINAYFDNGTIPEPPSSIGQFLSLSEQKKQEQTGADDPFPLPWTIKGEDVGLQEFPLPQDYQEQVGADAGEAAAQTAGQGGGEDSAIQNADTKAVTKPIEEYPAGKQSVIRSYLSAVDDNIKRFVQRVKAGDLTFRRQKISDVSERAAADIGELLNVDVSGYTHNINTHGIQHIINRHGESGKQDTSMAVESDIARIGWVLDNYDSVDIVTEDWKQVYSSEFLDTGHNPAPQIKFVKRIDGTYYIVEAAFENDYKKLWVQSAYLQKNEDVTQTPAEGVNTNHETNAQSASVSPSSNDTIAEVAPVVKNESVAPEFPLPPGYGDHVPSRDNLGPVREDIVTTEAAKTDEGMFPLPPGYQDTTDKQRKWVGTSTASKVVDGKVVPGDLDQELTHYQPISNKKTLGNANAKLSSLGYEDSLVYFRGRVVDQKVGLDDIALGERLIQEAVKKGDYETAGDLIMDISILGTELGQKVQALSIIKRLTPEGQLKMLQKTVERGKAKGDKAFDGVEITQEMVKTILETSNGDGTYDQNALNGAVEQVKQQIADQMKVTAWDYINEWRYLSMLGNPKTHIRNMLSNVAMTGTRVVKNAMARTIEDIAPVQNRTRTWESASDEVKAFAKQAATEAYKSDADSKYSDSGSIKAKRKIFKTQAGNWLANANSNALSWEDTIFSKFAYRRALQEYLTANGIRTQADIAKNSKLVAEAKKYAMDQAKEATFQQDSYIASKISEIERRSPAWGVAIGSTLPFKKTPVNIAKTAAAYSPLGFARNIYDAVQVKKGNMEVSEAIDHLAQTLTGTSLSLIGYALASMGILNGAGEDDKEGKYDYQLGEQSYSVTLGNSTYSLSWLSPVAMPLFVGVNAYEQLVEGKEWDANMVFEALGKTLDPMSEMSFLSSLDDVLSSYDSGAERFLGIFESMGQNYISQLIPTVSSQIAATLDDTKRTTKPSADSGFSFGEETARSLMYKIPGLRNMLEPATDIWGDEVKQSDNILTRAFESFLAPYSRRENIASEVDSEIKELYSQTGDSGLIPSAPYSYVSYKGEKYEMSAEEFTDYKKTYGQTAYDLMEKLFTTATYRNADNETKADMVSKVYDHARDEAKKMLLDGRDVTYTNATSEGVEYYKENPIVGAIEHDMSVGEYELFSTAPRKYALAQAVGGYDSYKVYREALGKIESDKDEDGNTVADSKKAKVIDYINSLDAEYGEKIILYVSQYPSKESRSIYGYEIVDYLNGRSDISYSQMVAILLELGFEVSADGRVTWD